jgi:tRNA threonylcarbamoyladenosine biosynthesis protein TsaB
MIILAVRTDKPEAELVLFDGQTKLEEIIWQAHRELAETIHIKIRELLETQSKSLKDLEGIITYQGPGSFTGLRIGLSVANALADSLAIPIVGAMGNAWQAESIKRLLAGESDPVVMPEYGAPVHITTPKH